MGTPTSTTDPRFGKCKRFFFPILSVLLLFSSCHNKMDGWEKTKESALVYHDADSFFGGEYSWTGDTLDFGVANGKGVFSYTDKVNKANNFNKNTKLYYGSLDKPSDIQAVKVGKIDDKGRLQGFGIKINGDVMHIGYFHNNKLKGDGVAYKENTLEYKGKFSNNLKNGKGKLYFADGKTLKYSGSFKKDNYNGKGILYDSIGRKVYEGNFSKGLYNGYGIAYDSLGKASKHVWSHGTLNKTTVVLYDNLNSHKSRFSTQQIKKIENRILKWERYYVWMYIGWGLFGVLLWISCAAAADEEDVNSRYDRSKPWNKYIIWLDWLFFGWLGVHRYVLRSKIGLIYPTLLLLILAANIREASIYLLYPTTWCLWHIGSFTQVCLVIMAAFLLYDFFWIAWRCYTLNHIYFRHDKNENAITLHKETPIMAFGNSVRPIATEQANILSNTLKDIKSLHKQEFKGNKGFLTRIGRSFSGNDPWLDFEKKRARNIQNKAKQAEIAQNKYAEMCEQLNLLLEESRANAYRNFTLAKELISIAIDSKGKKQVLVKDENLATDKLSLDVSIVSIDNIESGIDWESTADSAINISTELLSMGIKGPWAIGVGVGVSLLGGVLNSINAAQKACEEANRQCAQAISQLGKITNEIIKSQAAILRSGEMIIALNKANEAFWHAYIDLRDQVFMTEPSLKQFLTGVQISKTDLSDPEFRERVIHLIQVCSEYNKINSAKL